MRSLNIVPIIFFLTISLTSNAQASFDREFEAVKKELMLWIQFEGNG